MRVAATELGVEAPDLMDHPTLALVLLDIICTREICSEYTEDSEEESEEDDVYALNKESDT